MRKVRRCRALRKIVPGAPVSLVALLWTGAAFAQEAEDVTPEPQDGDVSIVVTAHRGSAVTNIPPIAEIDADMIAAIGATSVPELLQAIRGVTQSADGGEPIFLLNAQRVSGYQEIGSLPPEAIEKVEVLPEQAALKFGFPPTRRVVNFITKARFQQVELRGSAGTTTRLGSATEQANVRLTRLQDGRRLTLGLEYKHTDALWQSDRDILPDPQIPFDATGNVTGLGGGEIDPALSAAAGEAVTIVPVPERAGDRTIAGFAGGANDPRLFDLGPTRTLRPDNDTIKAEAVIADKIGGTMAGSLSLSAEQSRNRNVGGPAGARLIVPDSNPFSPFAGPVVLNRYLIEADPLRSNETVTTFNAGATLRGAIAGWRWDLTASYDRKQTDGGADIGIDPAAANAAIAAGADPFAPLDPSLLTGRLTEVTKLRTQNMLAKTVITNTPIRLPAGKISITATAEAGRATASSSSRGPSPSDRQLGRSRVEGGIAIDVPIASRREGVLGFAGELSVNASVNARQVSGFGGLTDSTFGAAWSPIKGLQLMGNIRRSATAPDMEQQSAPVSRIENVPVFDYGTGSTELVTLIRGGTPDLAAERRLTRSLTANLKPFEKSQLQLSATYEWTTIRDQTATIYGITPRAEALLPGLFVRDSAGRLVSVAYRPINLGVERQQLLRITLNSGGRIGKAPPPPAPGAKPPPGPPNYWGGIGPTIKFYDRLQLRPGTPELDLLRGETINGGGTPRVQGYAYGGMNWQGFGFNANLWASAPSRVRNDDPASDLRFGGVFRLNLGVYMPVHRLLPHGEWTRKLQLRLDLTNVTDDRQRVTDRNGVVPNRYQPDYLEPIGRTVTLSLRKLF